MKKNTIAGVVGGCAVFFWGAFAHMVLPVGEMGLDTLPNEAAVTGVLKQSLTNSGLYFFPYADMKGKPTPEQRAAWEAKYRAGPTGLLVYHATGEPPMTPRQLFVELATDIGSALILAWVFSLAPGSIGRRALLGGLFGLFAWLSIDASYWNWYGFPGTFMLGEALDQIVGWALGGVVMGLLFRRWARRAAA